MLAALLFAAATEAAEVGTVDAEAIPERLGGLAWQWRDGETRRYYLESEVWLPYSLWLLSRKGEARIAAFQVRTVLSCAPVSELQRGWELACVIEDIGLQAAAVHADRGLAGPILTEADQTLTGALLQVVLSREGRIRNVDLEGLERDNRRDGRIGNVLRLLLLRPLAGFDLQLPRHGVAVDGVWGQYDSQIFSVPASSASQGAVEMVHRLTAIEGSEVTIRTVARGTIAPPNYGDDNISNYYMTRMEGICVFDVAEGRVSEEAWRAVGWATASSAAAEIGRGQPYGQRGYLNLLEDGEHPDVGETSSIDLGAAPLLTEPPGRLDG